MPFPWYAGQVLTADRFNARNTRVVSQGADQTVTNSTTYVDTGLAIFVESGAVYAYELFLAYSASGAGDLKWRWSAPSGTLLASFTQAYAASASTASINDGSLIIQRRPANTTDRIAGGSDAGAPTNFHSAYDRGTITVGGAAGNLLVQFAQNTANANGCIVRGGNNSRLTYARIL